MNYTRAELARVSPERQRGLLWKARLSRLWKAYLRFAVALAGLFGTILLTLQYFILLPPFAWVSKRAARRAPDGLGRALARAPARDLDRAILMKILGISAHYHDAAAALLVDGLPVAAVQEERLSRRKNDAAFPIAAIEYCLDEAGLEPEDLDAVVFYERPMLKFDRVLTTAAARPSRARSSAFPHAMKNMLGEKAWVRGIISSRLGVPARKILFTEHHQSHAAAAFLTAPTREAAILTADGVGEWATLTAGRGARGPGGHLDRARARDPLPALARHALFDLHRLSRLRGQRGRV